MGDQLSKEQLLLLNNLMYMTNDYPLKSVDKTNAATVGEYVKSIQTGKLKDNTDYGSFMTGKDWKNIINAVEKDDQLMNMKIAETYVDSDKGGGGVSALFVDPGTNEAVVTFRGTASLEWKDNFNGGGPTNAKDGVSTTCQENVLNWYQSLDLDNYDTVTVTGHSKGGNKAKYITVMDDSVDRCYSFDGQGFSDEFFETYQGQITKNQEKIYNSNVESDYVNLLLNDVGNTTFYKGYDYGEGSFLENHCPNTFMDFQPDGSFCMNEGKRDGRMEQMDEFLNNYLRTLSPEDKRGTLDMIGKMVEEGFNGADANDILKILLQDKNTDYAADLAAYLLVYKRENPELAAAVEDVLNEMGLDNIAKTIDTVVDITDWEHFDKILAAAGWLTDQIPDFIYDWLIEKLKENGISLSRDELKKLLGMLKTMARDMENVKIVDNGADMTVLGIAGKSRFMIALQDIRQVEGELSESGRLLEREAERILAVCGQLGHGMRQIRWAVEILGKDVKKEAKSCKKMEQTLEFITNCYETTEQKIIANI